MKTLIGQKVRLPNNCACGAGTAVIGAGDGKHAATLACPQCNTSRGAISSFTLQWIEAVGAKFGAPATITLRRPPIPPVEAETVPSIDGANSNAMNRKGNHRGK
jgi:hypothetical protein